MQVFTALMGFSIVLYFLLSFLLLSRSSVRVHAVKTDSLNFWDYN